MECLQNISHKPRTCNDTLCISLFLLFWCFLILIIVFSNRYGNYTVAINGADSFGNICNQSHNKHFENFPFSPTDTLHKPNLLYFDTQNFDGVVRICVQHCQLQTFQGINSIFVYQADIPTQLCTYDTNVLKESHIKYENGINGHPLMSRMGPCPFRTAKSNHFKNICLPNEEPHDILKDFYALLNSGGLDQLFFIAVYQSWRYVAILCGFAFVISLTLLALMFLLTKILTWFVCALTIATTTALCIELWLNHNNYPFDQDLSKEEHSARKKFIFNAESIIFVDDFDLILWDLLDEFRINKFVVLSLAVATTFIIIILITTILILMKPLNRLKFLFDEAVVCIKHSPGLIIAPIIALLSMILLISLSGYTLLCLTTAKYPITSPTIDPLYNESLDPFADRRIFQQIEYVDSKTIRRTFWIYIIGFLWTTEFIFAFEEFCIGAAVGFWYFTPSSVDTPSLHAIGVLFKCHLGTIAKGSAVIALIKVPRLLLAFILKRIKQRLSQLWLQRIRLVEERIGIWNHNAYVPAAMKTTDLHPAALIAWKIFSKNAEQVESINNVFDFVLFLSKFLVAILTCLIGIMLLKDRQDYLFKEDRNEFFFYMAPVLFSTFCAFCIAHIVFSVFEMTVDTLLLCACENKLMYNGQKRLMMSTNLTKIFKNNTENSVEDIKTKRVYCLGTY